MKATRMRLLALTLCFTCQLQMMAQSPTPERVSHTIPIDGIRSFELHGWSEVVFRPGPPALVMTGTQEEIDNITIHRENGKMELREEEDLETSHSETLRIEITTTDPDLIRVHGAATMELAPGLSTSLLTIELDGVAQATLRIDTKQLYGQLSGIGELILSGQAEEGELSLSGIGMLDKSSFRTGDVSTMISAVASMK